MDELIEFMLICWCSSSMLMFASLLIQFNNAVKRGDKLRFDCFKSIFTHRNATNKQTMGKTIIQEMFIGLKINSRNYLIGSILLTAFAVNNIGRCRRSGKLHKVTWGVSLHWDRFSVRSCWEQSKDQHANQSQRSPLSDHMAWIESTRRKFVELVQSKVRTLSLIGSTREADIDDPGKQPAPRF